LACQAGLTEEQLALLLRSSEALVSLDAGAWDESAATLIERLEDEEALDPVEGVLNSERLELLTALMSGLSQTEKLIIEKRFGLVGDRTCTLQDIGQQLRVTRERVRQLEARALRKLRMAAVRNRLEEYLEI
jgi:RNA polymerase primary sigma factor